MLWRQAFLKKKYKMANKKTAKVKFLLSPTGEYNLAYNVGEVATLPEPLATELVENKYAKYVK